MLGTLLAGAAISAGISSFGLSPGEVFIYSAALVVPLGLWLLGRFFGPSQRVLQTVMDGIRSYRDRDFSMRIAVDRGDELGELVELYNAIGDVLRSERKELLQKEIMLDTVLQTTPMSIVLVNPADRIVLSNRSARTLLSEGRRLEGRAFAEVLESCPGEMRDVVAGGTDALFSIEQGEEEETFHLSQRVFHLNAQRHTLYMLNRLTPELRRQEVQVWKKVIRVIGHELNNTFAPVSSLLHSARRIVDRAEHTEKLGTIFDTIEERTTHLRSFLDGYASFARLPEPSRERVEWQTFLDHLQQMFQFRLEGKLPGEAGYFDPSQMQQVLINLLKNALEAESDPEQIALTVLRAPHGGTSIVVRDRGIGMDAEQLQMSMLPFYSSKKSGTGLGLPLCREILEAHGGRIRLQNREGGGTVVTCWLPEGPPG